MALDTQDIIIIVAAVVVTLFLLLCLINLCYFLWIRRDRRFTAGWADDDKNGNGNHHHYEQRSGAYQFNLAPDNQYEHSVQYTSEGPTRYNQVSS